MECKSIQSSSSSSTTAKYDVFVSFRGEDTRYNFTDHLFAAFQRKGIVAFRDDTNLRQGDHISTMLMQAIEGSQVLIVVFSKNYATSSWCLQELAKIMDCIKVPTGQSVLPVFYDVSPSEVRKQSGDYGIAFAEHEERFKHDLQMVQRWREALIQAANLSGWDVQNKPQYTEIEKIVERVWNKLDCSLSSLDGLVGMPPRVWKLEKLLELESIDDVRVIGICGMGGIGKTTLARAVYDKNSHQYNATCFIDDVSKVYHDCGPIGAPKQLICQTLKEENQQIWNLSKATYLIKSRLHCVKAFIVLDNVDKIEQLENLIVDRECLCAGSRIIIISRDRQILNNYGVDGVYDAELLNMDDACQLFCKKAFKRDYIISCDDLSKEYEVLVDAALNYAQCLPLALKVLGSFLFGKNISEWQSALARLRDNPNKDIMDVLQISFDGLEPSEKEIFLDIACFFDGSMVDNVKAILHCCGFHPEIGIKVLIDKSLITMSRFSINMHDKLQELGWKIVRQNAPNEPWNWSRIWLQEDLHICMSQKMALDNLEAVRLFCEENETLKAESISKMNRVRLLILNDEIFSGSLNYLSSDLRYLEWKCYPFTYFPSSCELIKLVELHLPYSKIKQLWKGVKLLDKLKIMDLSHSKNLVETPSFSGTLNLERLNLEGCTKLVCIHPSIGNLRKLVYLNLKNCTSLTRLPNNIFGVSSLEVVLLEGCSKLFDRELSMNSKHGISDTTIQCHSTSSIFKGRKLLLPFHFFNSQRHNNDTAGSLMPSFSRFQCLRELDLSFCNLFNIPDAMVSFGCLERLILKGNTFVTLPHVINDLPRLIHLNLEHCRQLTSLFEFPLRANLPVRRARLLHKDIENDAGLSIFDCPKLAEMESWTNVALSWMLQSLKLHVESSPCITIVIPGAHVPSWFNIRSVGDSIRIEAFPNVQDNNWIGFAFCAAFVAQYESPSVNGEQPNIYCMFASKNNDCFLKVAQIIKPEEITAELTHLCLVLLTRQQVIDFIQYEEDLDYGFYFTFVIDYGMHLEVKHCGLRMVSKQDLEE